MNSGSKEIVLSAVRLLVLTPLGTWLAAHGYQDASAAEMVFGAGVVLSTALWGMWQKWWAERKTVVRTDDAFKAGVKAEQLAIVPRGALSSETTQQMIKDFAPAEKGTSP